MSKRREITVRLGTESFYDVLDQKTPEQVIEEMQSYIRMYQGRKISFNVSPYGYDGGLELELWESREETDKEYDKRVAVEKRERDRKRAANKAKKDRELAEYVRLKKKFGDISYFDK